MKLVISQGEIVLVFGDQKLTIIIMLRFVFIAKDDCTHNLPIGCHFTFSHLRFDIFTCQGKCQIPWNDYYSETQMELKHLLYPGNMCKYIEHLQMPLTCSFGVGPKNINCI